MARPYYTAQFKVFSPRLSLAMEKLAVSSTTWGDKGVKFGLEKKFKHTRLPIQLEGKPHFNLNIHSPSVELLEGAKNEVENILRNIMVPDEVESIEEEQVWKESSKEFSKKELNYLKKSGKGKPNKGKGNAKRGRKPRADS